MPSGLRFQVEERAAGAKLRRGGRASFRILVCARHAGESCVARKKGVIKSQLSKSDWRRTRRRWLQSRHPSSSTWPKLRCVSSSFPMSTCAHMSAFTGRPRGIRTRDGRQTIMERRRRRTSRRRVWSATGLSLRTCELVEQHSIAKLTLFLLFVAAHS